ncbi:MAG: choice-of-anchor tandem repeat GloVer-containing protein [Candidatus Korobacteraceae bacterium]
MRDNRFSLGLGAPLVIFTAALLVTGSWASIQVNVLHSFGKGTDGACPYYAGLIIDATGNLYGTTFEGGIHSSGTVFELTPQDGGGWTEKVLHSFGSGTDGIYPYGGLIRDAAGNLYGTTLGGGIHSSGTVFELTPQEGGGWTEKVLHSFGRGTDGAGPYAGLSLDVYGNLYGTTSLGGIHSSGTVFELTPQEGGGWTEQVLHSFGHGTDGAGPYAGLIIDAAGNLYGTTLGGGIHSSGTVFELTPQEGGDWTEKVLHSFGHGTDGAGPYAGLIFDVAGNLYGTTFEGGIHSSGTVFELAPQEGGEWTEIVLHSFGSGTDGAAPYAGLMRGAVGNLYGTTLEGGIHSSGTVFELTPQEGGGWTEMVLHSFGSGTDGAAPYAGLTIDAAGNLYGTTNGGGIHDDGTVISFSARAFPIRASNDQRYLVDQNNVPFLLIGDAPHAMFANISVADARTYIADRAAHGITALWCELLINQYVGGRPDGSTYDGIEPFTGTLPDGYYDLTTPNPEYFARVDQMISIASSYNIVILLDSLETGGWMGIFAANGDASANSWGTYIGGRYKNFSNVIWIMGNDFQDWNYSDQDNTLAQNVMEGVASADPNYLQTTELNYYISGSLDDSLLVPYTTLAGAYTYYPTYYEVLQEYNSGLATVPAFMEEGFYDGINSTDLILRKQAYWTVLSGGLAGYIGGTQYYDFHSGWQSGIDDTAATQLGYWGKFTTSYPWYKLLPDQTHAVVTAGYGTPTGDGTGDIETDNYVTTGRDPDGSVILSYCPESTTVTVDMTKMRGPTAARWYDPTANTYQAISGSPFPNTGMQNFTTPGVNSEGDYDWILVLTSY